MSSPFGPKSAIEAEAGDLFLISRGEGAGLEVEKLDPTAAATAALIAAGIDAHLGSDDWRTGGSGGGGAATILSGSGAPAGATGSDGDFYIDKAAWTIYGPKASGSWGSGTALLGAPGAPGEDGDDGREVELQASGTHIQWRSVGEEAWTNLVALVTLTGAPGDDGDDGREAEFQVTATHIAWRLTGDVDWTELVALSSLQGAPGDPGVPGDDGEDGEDGAALAGTSQQAGTTYTFVLGDAEAMVEFTSGSAVTVTVPPNASVAFPIGTVLHVAQDGAGQVTIAPGAGVTIKKHDAFASALAGQHAIASLAKVGTNTWRLFGHLETA
jgi:hypothetical protein